MSEKVNVVELKRFASPQLPDATKKALTTALHAGILGGIWVLGLIVNNLSGAALDPLQVAGISAVLRVTITFLTSWAAKIPVVTTVEVPGPTQAPLPSQEAEQILARGR